MITRNALTPSWTIWAEIVQLKTIRVNITYTLTRLVDDLNRWSKGRFSKSDDHRIQNWFITFANPPHKTITNSLIYTHWTLANSEHYSLHQFQTHKLLIELSYHKNNKSPQRCTHQTEKFTMTIEESIQLLHF